MNGCIDYYTFDFMRAELAALQDRERRDPFPDVSALLATPAAQEIMKQVQQAIWSGRRLREKVRVRIASKKQEAAQTTSASRPPVMFLDISATFFGAGSGGIPRVCRKLLEQASSRSDIQAVVVSDDGEVVQTGSMRAVSFRSGDVLVAIDAFWFRAHELYRAMKRARHAGAAVVLCIHDVIPARHPVLVGQSIAEHFVECLKLLCPLADSIITVSSAATHEIGALLDDLSIPVPHSIDSIRLGADGVLSNHQNVRKEFARAYDWSRTNISVGTIKPHKGQFLAIRAFERLWAQGSKQNYLLIGKADADFHSPTHMIRTHPYFGKHLFWRDDVSDAELAYAYANARCLVQPSVDEGCGVPLLEALMSGLPIVASDIPVFREISDNNPRVTFFKLCDTHSLAESLRSIPSARDSSVVAARVTSWADTLDDLLDIRDRVLSRACSENSRLQAEERVH